MSKKTDKHEGIRWNRVYANFLLGVLVYMAVANYASLITSPADVWEVISAVNPVVDSLGAPFATSRRADAGSSHQVPAVRPGEITIVSAVSAGTLDLAVNWLRHLRRAVGKDYADVSLLLYVIGEEPRKALLASGLVREENLRDGTFGMEEQQAKDAIDAGAREGPGLSFLRTQRPRFLLEALQDRSGSSAALLFSDLDAVWRRDAVAVLGPLLHNSAFDVLGSTDDGSITGSFVIFRTSSPAVRPILRDWRDASSRGGNRRGKYSLHDILEAYQSSSQVDFMRLDLQRFPSGREFFRSWRRKSAATVVHTDHLNGLERRQKLRAVGLWALDSSPSS